MEVNHILRENWHSILLLVFMGFLKLTEDKIVELENYMIATLCKAKQSIAMMIAQSDEQETRRILSAVSLVFNLCLA